MSEIHKYNSLVCHYLFAESKLVFDGGPRGRPGGGERVSQKPKGREKPLTFQDQLKLADMMLAKITEITAMKMIGKLKDRKLAKKFDKKAKAIEKKVNKIKEKIKNATAKHKEIMKTHIKSLDNIIFKLTGKRYDRALFRATKQLRPVKPLKIGKIPSVRRKHERAKVTPKVKEKFGPKQKIIAEGLIKLANRENPSSAQLQAIKDFMKNMKPGEYKDFKGGINGFPVHITFSRSSNGKFFRLGINCDKNEYGYEPQLIGEDVHESVLFLGPNGKRARPDANTKFSYENIRKAEFPNTPKGNLSKMLSAVLRLGYRSFEKNKDNIMKIVNQLKQQASPGHTKTVNLPGGYTLAYPNWTRHKESRPSAIIYKGGRMVGYVQRGKLIHAHAIRKGEGPGRGMSIERGVAERLKCKLLALNTVSSMKSRKGDIPFGFPSFSSMANFKDALQQFAKLMAPYKLPGNKYQFRNIRMWKKPGGHAVYDVRMPNGSYLAYDTRKPKKIGVIKRNVSGDLKDAIYHDESRFLITKTERREDVRKRENVRKQREVNRRNESNRKRGNLAKTELGRVRKTRETSETNEKSARVKKLLGKAFKKFKKLSEYIKIPAPGGGADSFKVDIPKKPNNKATRRLLYKVKNSMAIHDLLDFKRMGKKVVMIEIKGKKAMYYPGQKSCYPIKGGKQIARRLKDRIKFGNGDIIKILDVRTPTRADYKMLSKVDRKKYGGKQKRYDKLRIKENADKIKNNSIKSVQRFIRIKGAMKDLKTMSQKPEFKKLFQKLIKLGIKNSNITKIDVWKKVINKLKNNEQVKLTKMMDLVLKKIAEKR